MPRILPVDPSTTTGPVAEQLAGTRQVLGATPNLFLTAANSAVALTALNGFFVTLGKGELGPRIGERLGIAVAQANGCEYCLSAHTALGGLHGVNPDELATARDGRSADSRAQAALTFGLAVLDAKGSVTDATLDAARAAGLTDSEIVEVVAHVALNIFTNYLNNLAGTEVDFPLVALEKAA